MSTPFTIQYRFSTTDNTADQVDLTEADEMSFSYDLFLGSLTMECNGRKITIVWDWIPLLDFAQSLRSIALELSQEGDGTGEYIFAESDENLYFELREQNVEVSTSYSDETMSIPFSDFREGAMAFYKKIVLELLDKYPELQDNSVFEAYLLRIGEQ